MKHKLSTISSLSSLNYLINSYVFFKNTAKNILSSVAFATCLKRDTEKWHAMFHTFANLFLVDQGCNISVSSKAAKNVNDTLNPLSAKITKWSNTLKQFVGKLPTNCLSVFDHFVGLALKGLNYA